MVVGLHKPVILLGIAFLAGLIRRSRRASCPCSRFCSAAAPLAAARSGSSSASSGASASSPSPAQPCSTAWDCRRTRFVTSRSSCSFCWRRRLFPAVARLAERPLIYLARGGLSESSGIVLGASLGLVFVPCAGPVLAAVTALSATGGGGLETFFVAVAYASGAAVPMLAIAVGGKRLTEGVGFLRQHAETTRRAGALIGVSAIAIALGADQRFHDGSPRLHRGAAGKGRAERHGEARARPASAHRRRARAGRVRHCAGAPGSEGSSAGSSTDPVSLRRLRGRVVLIDFWTYSCVNCLRTLPHLKAWDRMYRDDGLTIVGVRSEFAFEREPDNVLALFASSGFATRSRSTTTS